MANLPNNQNQMSSITEANSKTSLAKVEAEPDLVVEGELNLSDYILEVEPNERTVQAMYAWTVRKRELTKEKLLRCLTKTFAGSLAASFLLVGVAVANPNVDKGFVKDVIPMIISPQVTLLGGAFGAYVFHSRSTRKK